MSRFRTSVIVLAIGLFALLPLHEIVDYGEHWPNDGNYASIVLSVLFLVGLAFTARRAAATALEQSAAFTASAEAMTPPLDSLPSHTAGTARPDLPAAHIPIFFAGSTSTPPFVVVHAFRI